MIEFSFIINILQYFTAFSVFQITFFACKIFDTLLVELSAVSGLNQPFVEPATRNQREK